MSDDKKEGAFADLFNAVDVVVGATNELITLAGALNNVLDLDAGAVLNAVTKNANDVKRAMDKAYEGTKEADRIISKLDPKHIAESAKDAVSTLVGSSDSDITESINSIAKNAVTSQVGASLPIGQFVSLLDSTRSGAAFGYEPVESAINDARKLFGKDSDVGKFLGDIGGIVADAAPIAIPFISAVIDGVLAEFAHVAQVSQEIVSSTNARMVRLDNERRARRGPKPASKTLMRIDGRAYAASLDAQARDNILGAVLFKFAGGGKKPGVADSRKYGGEYGGTTLGELELEALTKLISQTNDDVWAVRKRVAYEFNELRARETELLVGGRGKLYATIDGQRSIEFAKDLMLMRLVRDGHVSAKEVQFAFDFNPAGALGPYDANATDNALMYAATAPGAQLWAYWNELAAKQKRLYSGQSILRGAAVSRLSRTIQRGNLATRAGAFVSQHPVATAGAAGALFGGLFTVMKK